MAARTRTQRANETWKRMLRDYEAPTIDPGLDEALQDDGEERRHGREPILAISVRSEKILDYIKAPRTRQILSTSTGGPAFLGIELSPFRRRQLTKPMRILASGSLFFWVPVCIFFGFGGPPPGLLGLHDATLGCGTSAMLACGAAMSQCSSSP